MNEAVGDEHVEVGVGAADDVIEVVALRRRGRRSWWGAVAACGLLLAAAVWAATAGDDTTSARSELVGEGPESGATTGTDVVGTDETSTTVEDGSLDGGASTESGDSTPLGDEVLLPEPGTFSATYAEFVNALRLDDQAFVDLYCSTYPPGPWVMPDLVGRNSGSLLTDQEQRLLVEIAGCASTSVGWTYVHTWPLGDVLSSCTSDPVLDGTVASQSIAPGPQPQLVVPFQITVHRYCGQPSTTVCVEVTMPWPPYEGATTTIGWDCR